MAEHRRLDVVRTHLLEMAADYETAIAHYSIPASRTTTIPESNFVIANAALTTENITKAGVA